MKEASHKKHILYDSVFMKCPEWAGGDRRVITKGYEVSFLGDKNVLKLIVVMVA